jgi:SAM-dependent methyltransferase
MTLEQKSEDAGEQQARMWNGPSGRAWVDAQEALDQAFLPFEEVLTSAVTAAAPAAVLDVGCGTGSTTLAVARVLGTRGHSTGVDISAPMLALARARAERAGVPATFIEANAQTHAFAKASVDLVISRFGVMFFDDPVRAFANLRGAVRLGGLLRCVAWRGPADNPFMTTAERAGAPLLPQLPPRQPDGPGQFAFADRDRVRRLLRESGWKDIDVQPLDRECTFPEGELVRYFTRLGPVGAFLREADEPTRQRVVETVRPAFDPYVVGTDVRFNAACWLVSAAAD